MVRDEGGGVSTEEGVVVRGPELGKAGGRPHRDEFDPFLSPPPRPRTGSAALHSKTRKHTVHRY